MSTDATSFEWHGPKAKSNERKHGVTFKEGATIFEDERALFVSDPDVFDGETRWVLLGQSHANRLLAVVHVECGNVSESSALA